VKLASGANQASNLRSLDKEGFGMTGRKTITGLCLLCALVLGAVSAQSAIAVKGTTLFTCKNEGPGHNFTKSHCKAGDFSPGNGEFEHVPIKEGTTTELKGSNVGNGADTNTTVVTTLKSTIAGVSVGMQTTGVLLQGWVTNAKDPGTGEHYFHGRFKITHTGATVTAPKEKGCKIKGEEIVSKELAFTSAGKGDAVAISPVEGTVLEAIEVEGCSMAGLNGTYELKGSISCPLDGATITCTHASTTEQGTLTLKGQKAGIEGTVTVSGRDPELKETTYTPLSPTTVETP
jgi:hypothetical protein